MRAFFKMQLKIYFRLASSYVSPLVIGAFYIILVAAVRLSVGADWCSKNFRQQPIYRAICKLLYDSSFYYFIICNTNIFLSIQKWGHWIPFVLKTNQEKANIF